jgi:aspartate/methionine/tyrosine aminotransferase
LERERLALVPGIAFGSRGEGHFRISYSSPVEALEEGVRRLSRYMMSPL